MCSTSSPVSYLKNMLKIGMLTLDSQRGRQVQEIFPEWEMHIEQLASPEDVLRSAEKSWTALVVDLDAVEPQSPNLFEFVEAMMTRTMYAVVLIPPRLMHTEAKLVAAGVFVLKKPTSSGEIALALRMLLKEN